MAKISKYTAATLFEDDDIFVCVKDGVTKKITGAQIRSGIGSLRNETLLSITGSIAAVTPFSVTSGGTGYTKSGDDGNLLASAALFNEQESISIFLNGVYQEKGIHATWLSAASFKLDVAVDNGDEITIIS